MIYINIMKRYSPILFIWLASLFCLTFITIITYINGDIWELFAWGTATTFLLNLIVYHFYVTRNEKKKDGQLLDE